MHDSALKRIFSHPATIERAVHFCYPDRASDIDFSTLEPMDSGLVSDVLEQRRADALWRARRHDGTGEETIIHLEFQGRSLWHMAVRMAVYGLLALQVWLRRRGRSPRIRSRTSLPTEVLSIVIHHGGDRWTATRSLTEFLPRWTPGDYRVISARPRAGEAAESNPAIGLRDQLPRTVLRLGLAESPEEVVAHIGELEQQVEDGGSEYDRFMAGCIAEMLISQGWATEQLKEATTMSQVSTEFPNRWMEEFGRKRYRQGREEGRAAGHEEGLRQGQAKLLLDLAARKFGPQVAHELSSLPGREEESARIHLVSTAVIESETAEEFLGWVRRELLG